MTKVWDDRLAVPVDPLRGIVNDGTDMLGIWRPEEFVPLVSALLKEINFPTLEQFAPSPKDVGDAIVYGNGGKGGVIPKLPWMPTPKQVVVGTTESMRQLPTPFNNSGMPALPGADVFRDVANGLGIAPPSRVP